MNDVAARRLGSALPPGTGSPVANGLSMSKISWMERAFRHDRALVVTGLVLVIGLCWTYLIVGAAVMEPMERLLLPPAPASWSVAYGLLMLVMWAVMMAAMMLPSAAPMILLYAAMARRQLERGQASADAGAFTLGYVLVWAGFSLAATLLQFGLERLSLMTPMMQTSSVALAGAVLIGAGIYQWTPLKQACLRLCRSPLNFMLTEWREGSRGAFIMGLRHGAYCVGCCWVLMLLLFVGGVMNLLWIAGLALFVLVEKVAPAGLRLGQFSGALLVIWGIGTWLSLL